MTTNPKYAPITAAHNWFCGEKKILRIGPIQTSEDISGWTLKWQFRLDEPDVDALITKLDADITPNNTTKMIDVPVEADETDELGPTNGAHALMRVDTGNEGVICFGPAFLQQAAVRS